ncbi:transient receptor potential cation channel subfamily M member-like 2 isoform X2 [Clavelina lepadiformis]|uniref:transient receptor potential cation channel subfamily M member-like 2 isoform X2 n=1 Tax=Clavelina lepadiformis TaxID=159417 RepID=UPI004041F849
MAETVSTSPPVSPQISENSLPRFGKLQSDGNRETTADERSPNFLSVLNIPVTSPPVSLQISMKSLPRFGKLQFDGNRETTAHYAIVSKDSTPETIHEIISKKWNLTAPSVILSIAGGGGDEFVITSGMTKEFRTSVNKIALQTGGWILTSGTNSSVVKLIGETVDQYTSANKDQAITTLGVATFGDVSDNAKLYEESFGESDVCIQYESRRVNSLQKNHTHFILIEDGQRFALAEPRAKLEHLISQKVGNKVPLVCLLLNGGFESLKAVHQALKNKTPVIVIAESKGCAGILSNLYNRSHKAVTKDKIGDLSADEEIEHSPADLARWTELAKDCIKMKQHMTIFFTDDDGSFADLDQSVLKALIKDQEFSTKHLLKLAMEWDRCEFAKTRILTEGAEISDEELWPFFKQALQEDRTDFIKMFLDWNVRLIECLTPNDVTNLYVTCVKQNTPLSNFMGRKEWDYDRTFTSLMKVKRTQTDAASTKITSAADHKWALRELFKWAVLLNRRTTSRILWDAMSEDQLPAAIVASSMLIHLAGHSDQTEWKKEYKDHASAYRNLAEGILTKCFEQNADRTAISLTRKLHNWGNKTCLQLAVGCMDFDIMAHAAVHWHLHKTWLRGIVQPRGGYFFRVLFWIKLLVSFILPIFIPLLVEFEGKTEESASNTNASNTRGLKYSVTNESFEMDVEANDRKQTILSNGGTLSRLTKTLPNSMTVREKIYAFYQAPLVKFIMHVLFFVGFLLFFAYNIVFDFDRDLNGTCHGSCIHSHWILLGWTTAIAIDEFHEIYRTKSKVLWKKVVMWISEPENILDVIAFYFFFPGIFLSLSNDVHDNYAGRELLACSFCIYTMRLFSLFRVHGSLGPKLLMVTRMMKDLGTFLFIWAIILFAYGVSSQALLFPKERNVGEVFKGIITRPYWHIYGELSLDEVDYDEKDNTYHCNDSIPSTDRVCPNKSEFVPILLGIYMLLVSVLLLNFLIAMFSYTFDKLICKTDVIWKFQQYQLVEEYYHYPCLVAPLNIFYYLYRIIAWVARFTCNGCQKSRTKFNAFEKIIAGIDLQNLVVWEQEMTQEYLEKERKELEADVPHRLDKLAIMLNSIQMRIQHQEKSNSIRNGSDFLVTEKP